MKKENAVSMEQYTMLKLVMWSGLGVPFGWVLGVIGIVLAYFVAKLIVSKVFTVSSDTTSLKKGVSVKTRNVISWTTTVILSLIFCLGTLYFRGVMEYLPVILAYVLSKCFVDSYFYVVE